MNNKKSDYDYDENLILNRLSKGRTVYPDSLGLKKFIDDEISILGAERDHAKQHPKIYNPRVAESRDNMIKVLQIALKEIQL